MSRQHEPAPWEQGDIPEIIDDIAPRLRTMTEASLAGSIVWVLHSGLNGTLHQLDPMKENDASSIELGADLSNELLERAYQAADLALPDGSHEDYQTRFRDHYLVVSKPLHDRIDKEMVGINTLREYSDTLLRTQQVMRVAGRVAELGVVRTLDHNLRYILSRFYPDQPSNGPTRPWWRRR